MEWQCGRKQHVQTSIQQSFYRLYSARGESIAYTSHGCLEADTVSGTDETIAEVTSQKCVGFDAQSQCLKRSLSGKLCFSAYGLAFSAIFALGYKAAASLFPAALFTSASVLQPSCSYAGFDDLLVELSSAPTMTTPTRSKQGRR